MRIAVIGASGTIGCGLVPALAREHEVLALARRPTVSGGAVTSRAADARDRDSLVRAIGRADVLYHLVHSLGTRSFAAEDRRAAEAVASAAARVGASQIVYLGGLADDAAGRSEHLRSRAETARYLASGPVPVTTLRAAMVVGRGSAALETIRALVDRLPAMVCPRWVANETEPVALTDVVRYLVGVAGRDEALARGYDVGGPEVMTYRMMIERIGRLRARRPRIAEVPLLSPRVSSLWLHLVTPVEASVARPLVESLCARTVAREHEIRELVPFSLTPFDDAAREALSA